VAVTRALSRGVPSASFPADPGTGGAVRALLRAEAGEGRETLPALAAAVKPLRTVAYWLVFPLMMAVVLVIDLRRLKRR
jgi:hypothetical protein